MSHPKAVCTGAATTSRRIRYSTQLSGLVKSLALALSIRAVRYEGVGMYPLWFISKPLDRVEQKLLVTFREGRVHSHRLPVGANDLG